MVTIFRTADQAADSRSSTWRATVGKLLLPMSGHATRADFEAEMAVGDLGAVRVAQVTTPAGECVRSPDLIGHRNADLYQFDVLLRGEVQVSQNHRDTLLRAGDLTFVDPVRPVTYRSTATTHVSVFFPRTLLPLRDRDARAMTAVRVAGDRGSGALVSAFAAQLLRHLGDVHGTEALRLGTSLVDLFGLALSSAVQRPQTLDPDHRRRALRQHIYAFIGAHLSDADLTPDAIAAAHHISVRYLHKLFQDEALTVTAWIRERRLEECRRDLLNPARQDRSVAAVGATWGMPNAAHFSRAFKATYGSPPAAYRAARAGTAGFPPQPG